MTAHAAIPRPTAAPANPRARVASGLMPFTLDLRSIALFRVALGGMLLTTFAWWAVTFVRAAETGGPLTTTLAAQAGALGLMAVTGMALLAGWGSRSAALLGVLATLALHVTGGAPVTPDVTLLRIALLWTAVLPVGERFAIDTAVRGPSLVHSRIAGMATVGVMLQLLAVYLSPAVVGDHADLRSVTPLARGLETQSWWAGAVVWTEVVEAVSFGMLIAAFAFGGRPRLIAAVMMATLHTLLGLTLELGMVHFVLAAMWLLLLPSPAWNWLERRVWTGDRLRVRLWHSDRDDTQIARVRLLRTFLLLPPTAARPTSEDIDMDVFRRQRDSWVVTDAQGYRYVKFRALSAAFLTSPIFWPIGVVLHIGFIESIGDWLYDLTKRRRGPLVLLATRTSAPAHTAAHEALAAALLIALLGWQLWVSEWTPPAAWGPWWVLLRSSFGG